MKRFIVMRTAKNDTYEHVVGHVAEGHNSHAQAEVVAATMARRFPASTFVVFERIVSRSMVLEERSTVDKPRVGS